MTVQLAWPARLDSTGALAVVGRDTDAGVAQAVRLTLASRHAAPPRPGDRLVASQFGIPDPTYIGMDADEVLAAVERWAPRAEVTIDAGIVGNGHQDVTVTVTRKRD